MCIYMQFIVTCLLYMAHGLQLWFLLWLHLHKCFCLWQTPLPDQISWWDFLTGLHQGVGVGTSSSNPPDHAPYHHIKFWTKHFQRLCILYRTLRRYINTVLLLLFCNIPFPWWHITIIIGMLLWYGKTPHHNRFTAISQGPPGWASARRELLDFIVQGKINTGRNTDHPAGCHSIRTNQCLHHPPIFLQAGCPSCRRTNSVKALIW